MGTNETIVTVGMRGDGDEPMTEGTAIDLLENIVKTQREIISNVTENLLKKHLKFGLFTKKFRIIMTKECVFRTILRFCFVMIIGVTSGNYQNLNAEPR